MLNLVASDEVSAALLTVNVREIVVLNVMRSTFRHLMSFEIKPEDALILGIRHII